MKIYDPKVHKDRIIHDLLNLNKKKNQLSDELILNNLVVCKNIDDALLNSDIIAILTEWEEFKNINTKEKIIDTRNICANSNVVFNL